MKLFRMLAIAMMVLKGLEKGRVLLEYLAKDDYPGATQYLLGLPELQDELQRLPAEVVAAAPLLLPLFLQALDRVVPEEQLLAAMG